MSYTDAQKFRAARAVLKWTQTELGKKGGVCASTIAQFESEKRDMYHNNKVACWKAFDDAGITFRGNLMIFNPPATSRLNNQEGEQGQPKEELAANAR